MLLLSICSVGSLFTGSPQAIRQGMHIFERLHKAVLANWDRMVAQGMEESLSMVQTALVGQTFGLLSGEPRHLAIFEVFHGTVIAWARRLNAFGCSHSQQRDDGDQERSLQERWEEWARREELIRIATALQIHDAELVNIFHHEPFLRHSGKQSQLAAADDVFMAQKPEDWWKSWHDKARPEMPDRGAANKRSSQVDLFPFPSSHRFAAYAILEDYSVMAIEIAGDFEASETSRQRLQDQLLDFYQKFLKAQTVSQADHLGLTILWHMTFMSLCTDFNLLERAIGRDGSQVTPEDQARVLDWANSIRAQRCLVHASIIQKRVETMPFCVEPAIHVPRAMFRSGVAWFCHTRYGGDATNHVASQALDFPESKALGINATRILFEANGYRQGRPKIIEASAPLCAITDLLQRIGHWEIARRFGDILGALINNEAG